jgi:hypothetical protein
MLIAEARRKRPRSRFLHMDCSSDFVLCLSTVYGHSRFMKVWYEIDALNYLLF